MSWQPCDLYQCANSECKSKVMVLQSPRATALTFGPPLCVCGHRLERLPTGIQEPLRTWTF